MKFFIVTFLSIVLFPQLTYTQVGEDYTLQNIDINDNTNNSGVSFYKENYIVHTSPKKGQKIHDSDFYFCLADEGGNVNDDKLLEGNYNSYINEIDVTYTLDYKKVYFTRSYIDNDKKEHFDIYIADVDHENAISNIKQLPICYKNFSTAYPSLSKDGKTLYFASDRKEALGGFDIFKVSIIEHGVSYGKVINLGSSVNTKGNEITPFILGNRLFFSSNGREGYGKYDVYSIRANNLKLKSYNLGKTINSTENDFGYIRKMYRNYGYLISNRAGGKGKNDIYYFKAKAGAMPEVAMAKSDIIHTDLESNPVEDTRVAVVSVKKKEKVSLKELLEENGSVASSNSGKKAILAKELLDKERNEENRLKEVALARKKAERIEQGKIRARKLLQKQKEEERLQREKEEALAQKKIIEEKKQKEELVAKAEKQRLQKEKEAALAQKKLLKEQEKHKKELAVKAEKERLQKEKEAALAQKKLLKEQEKHKEELAVKAEKERLQKEKESALAQKKLLKEQEKHKEELASLKAEKERLQKEKEEALAQKEIVKAQKRKEALVAKADKQRLQKEKEAFLEQQKLLREQKDKEALTAKADKQREEKESAEALAQKKLLDENKRKELLALRERERLNELARVEREKKATQKELAIRRAKELKQKEDEARIKAEEEALAQKGYSKKDLRAQKKFLKEKKRQEELTEELKKKGDKNER